MITCVRFEENAIKKAYQEGVISREEFYKLMDDIMPMLWDELYHGL